MLFAFARPPALGHRMGFDTGRIDVSIECTAFKRFRVTEHLLDVAHKRGNSVSMVAKSVEAWSWMDGALAGVMISPSPCARITTSTPCIVVVAFARDALSQAPVNPEPAE